MRKINVEDIKMHILKGGVVACGDRYYKLSDSEMYYSNHNTVSWKRSRLLLDDILRFDMKKINLK